MIVPVIVKKGLCEGCGELCNIQGDSGRKVNIFGGDVSGHCVEKAYAKGAGIMPYTG